jgi:tripartite-type tricarboxylate transporter receptor subunit TctC
MRFARRHILRSAALFAGLAGLLQAGTAAADPIADFYTGKTVRIVVGSAPGGGYDLYARHLSRHIGRHIPGNPTVIVQNMPGAGGLTATNYLYAKAPRDGTTFGIVQGTLIYAQAGNSANAQFDMRKFGWLGSANNTSNICVFPKRTLPKDGKELLEREVIIGTSAGSTELIPTLLNNLAGTKFKMVRGFQSTTSVLLAIERGEVDGLCGWGWDGAQVNGRDFFARGVIQVGLECANERHPVLKERGVPFALDLVKSEKDRKVMEFLFSYLVYVRPFIAPPELPDDRLKALQNAFKATLEDPEFLAEAEKGEVEIRYVSPDQVHTALGQVLDAPEDVKEAALDQLRQSGWGGL